MENIESLTRLEGAVEKLLATVSEINQEKLLLKDRLDGRDQEIASLKEQLQVLQNERSQVGQRVDNLLGAIDKWEKLNDAAVVGGEPVTAVQEKTLF